MSSYIDNYATPGNPVRDIGGSLLNVVLNFEDKGAAGPSDHPLAPFAGLIGLPASLTDTLAIPLDRLGNQLWAGDKDSNGLTLSDRTRALITGQIVTAVRGQGNDYSAYNVTVSLPSTGAMRSIVLTGALTNPDAHQIVLLSYELTGISAGFAATTPFTGGFIPDPRYTLSLDLALVMQIVIPKFPGALTNTASFNVENARIVGSNITADVGDAIFSAFAFFTEQPTNIFQAVEGGIDSTGDASSSVGALGAILAQLGAAWRSAAPRSGLKQMEAFIDARPALNFRFVHPVDPAPTVVNSAVPSFPSFSRPLLGTSAASVVAGGSLGVTGTFFPVGQADQSFISWNDTVSGQVVSSDINWGPVNGPRNLVNLLRIGSSPAFATPTLQPNTAYSFSVRDEDFLTETPFSAPITITTQPTNRIDFLLLPAAGGPSSVVGTVELTPNGSFTAAISIPPGSAAGTYTLVAVLAGSSLATTGFEVVAQGHSIPPVIEVIDPSTNQTFHNAEEETAFTLRGAGFRPGALHVAIDTTAGQSLGTVLADASGSFQSKLTWPFGFNGQRTVVADQAGGGPDLQASWGVFVQQLPR